MGELLELTGIKANGDDDDERKESEDPRKTWKGGKPEPPPVPTPRSGWGIGRESVAGVLGVPVYHLEVNHPGSNDDTATLRPIMAGSPYETSGEGAPGGRDGEDVEGGTSDDTGQTN